MAPVHEANLAEHASAVAVYSAVANDVELMLTIYPNPFNNSVTVHFHTTILEEMAVSA